MATYKCNDGVYTVLRNGKVIAFNTTSATALTAVVSDAANVVCPPECCITDVPITIDSFDIVITTTEFTGLFVRATITHALDIYSTQWVAAAATNTIDLTGLLVEITSFDSGDTICIDYTYDQITVIDGCCLTVLTDTVLEDDTYQLSELVRECDGGTFDLVFQNPDGGVTVDADGEMVVPDIEADETVYVTYTCDGCVTELLILEATNVVPLEGLRLTYTPGNLPANNLAAWNAFFDLPANGTAFTSLATAGDEVTLFGGAGITLKASLFLNNADLLKIEDDTDCVVAIAGGSGTGALSTCGSLTTVTLNGVITAAEEGLYSNSNLTALSMDALTTAGINCFKECTSMVTFDLPALVTAGDSCFYDCGAATSFSFPLLTSAGVSSFRGCTSATTFTLPELVTAGDSCFASCPAATTFTLPLCTTIGNSCFRSCTAATTFDISACTNLGGTAGYDGVFDAIAGNTIAVTIPIAQQTIDGGNPDGDLVYLDANNTATFTFI